MQTDVLAPGQALARGVMRHFCALGFACLDEFTPVRGARVDVVALGPKGEIWVVECKSSRADYTSDGKWSGYLDWCDRFFWAVGSEFPAQILPEGSGIILADRFGAEVQRMGPEHKLAPARRKALIQRFATQAAFRLHRLRDPARTTLSL